MIRPTVSQSILTSRQIALLSVLVASHATSCSKSRVNPQRCRANGTPWRRTPCSGTHAAQLGAELQPPEAEVEMPPDRRDLLAVVTMTRGERPQRALQPTASERDADHHPILEELHL